jgi:polyhydroxybutyrate depolymerase
VRIAQRLARVTVLLLALGLGSCQAQPVAESGLRSASVPVDGLTRTFELYTPRGHDPNRPTPLVLVFHGGFGNGAQVANRLGMNAVADRGGFLVAYPDGYDKHWNDGRTATSDGPDDVRFVRALIDEVGRHHQLDAQRIYATGLSNGGYFTQRLACEMSAQIAAFAPVMATMPVPLQQRCAPGERKVPMLMISGVDDPLVPYQGGELTRGRSLGGKGGEVISVPDAAAFWARHNGCNMQPQQQDLPDTDPRDGTRVRQTLYLDCDGDAEVKLLSIDGGGHTWPGSRERKRIRRIVGATSYDINASEVIWAFFRDRRLSPQHGDEGTEQTR